MSNTIARNASRPVSAKALTQNGVMADVFTNIDTVNDLVCFSHLRWDFVYQRPQHLLSRASQNWRIWHVEEPMWGETLRLEVRPVTDRIRVVVPHLPHGIDEQTALRLQRQLVNQLLERESLTDFIAWYYTPMALQFTDHLQPRLTVYDCMDELSAFRGASPLLISQEENLMQKADLVFTGGHSLYEAKQKRHKQVYAFPSCIDIDHFLPGRGNLPDPDDQRLISKPRIGYCGVIDERLNLTLLGELAQRRPDWQFVLLGPIVKIDHATLPQGPNLHYLGMKSYQELPPYMSNWQAAILPFAINEATRYISPTKTPEYLAAGLPVVSTPIRDVIRTYGNSEAVSIADTAPVFEKAIEQAMNDKHELSWEPIDGSLREHSWDNTWQQMHRLMRAQLQTIYTEQ